jgi:hypothetical protein
MGALPSAALAGSASLIGYIPRMVRRRPHERTRAAVERRPEDRGHPNRKPQSLIASLGRHDHPRQAGQLTEPCEGLFGLAISQCAISNTHMAHVSSLSFQP